MEAEKPRYHLLLYSVLGAAGFALLVASLYQGDGGALYYFFLFPFIYFFTGVLLLVFIAGSRRRLRLVALMAVATLILVGLAAIPAPDHGSPAPSQGYVYQQTCTSFSYTNSTYGFDNTTGTQCFSVRGAYSFFFGNIFIDLAYWLPVAGLAVYALPESRKGKTVSDKLAYVVFSGTLAAALLIPLLNILPFPAGLS